MLDYIKALPDKEREQELGKLRHCAVSRNFIITSIQHQYADIL